MQFIIFLIKISFMPLMSVFFQMQEISNISLDDQHLLSWGSFQQIVSIPPAKCCPANATKTESLCAHVLQYSSGVEN